MIAQGELIGDIALRVALKPPGKDASQRQRGLPGQIAVFHIGKRPIGQSDVQQEKAAQESDEENDKRFFHRGVSFQKRK